MSRITPRCCACWRVVIRRSRGRGTSRCVGSTRWSASSCLAASRSRSLPDKRSRSSRARTGGAVGRERHLLAFELLDDVARFDEQRKASERRIKSAVVASGTTLTEVFGIGDVVAATLIGHTGDVSRFATEDKFAAYNGTAPIEWSSGNPKRPTHRLSRRGNRTMNHALHIAAVTQLRHAHSPGRAFYDRKRDEGHTSKSAIRALKRRLSNTAYRHLVADARPAKTAS